MKKFIYILVLTIVIIVACGCTPKDKIVENESEDIIKIGELIRASKIKEDEATYLQNLSGENDGEIQEKIIKKVYFDDLNSALLALERGDIDRLNVAKSTADYIIAQNPNKYTKFIDNTDLANGDNNPSSAESNMPKLDEKIYGYAMAAKENETELISDLDRAIKYLSQKGVLDELANTYLNDIETPDTVNTLPYIDGAKTYKVVLTGDNPPLDYLTPSNEPAGYDVALLSEISKYLNINFEVITSDTNSRFLMLTSGKADIVFLIRDSLYASDIGNLEATPYERDLPEGMIATSYYNMQSAMSISIK